jgi:catechol 2,3-dioxygenase-like lactoylglutathione lyase family enzyme
MTVFTRIDTIVLRVTDYSAASDWYCTNLGFTVVFADPGEGLAVLGLGQGTSLTLWQLQPGEAGPKDSSGCPFPIIASSDASAQRRELMACGIRTSDLSELPGLRFFSFWDLDGNRLEGCEVVVGGPVTMTHR